MELIFMHYLLLCILWASLTFQLFLDENRDGQHQPTEPGLPGQPYTVTWLDGDTSSIAQGTTLTDGYIAATGEGQLTLETPCTVYTATVDDVSGQAVIPLACPAQRLYLPIIGAALDAEIDRLQRQMRRLLGGKHQ